jgi:hypothetical protein
MEKRMDSGGWKESIRRVGVMVLLKISERCALIREK